MLCCSKELKQKKSRQNKKVATLLQVSGKVVDFQIEDTIMNLSNTALSSDEIEVLKYGLKHGLLVPIDCKEIKIKFENLFQKLVHNGYNTENNEDLKAKLKSIASRFMKKKPTYISNFLNRKICLG